MYSRRAKAERESRRKAMEERAKKGVSGVHVFFDIAKAEVT